MPEDCEGGGPIGSSVGANVTLDVEIGQAHGACFTYPNHRLLGIPQKQVGTKKTTRYYLNYLALQLAPTKVSLEDEIAPADFLNALKLPSVR